MDDEPGEKSTIGFEVAFAVVVGFALFMGNILIAAAADRFSLFNEYLKASVLIIPAISVLVVAKSRLGDGSGVGAILLGFLSTAIVLLNLLFIGYGEVG